MTFEQKVRSMTAKQIIMAMVTALTHPPMVKIDMNSYGTIKYDAVSSQPVCFGCAATNTICQIGKKVFTPDNIEFLNRRAKFMGSSVSFLYTFERAINSLRLGGIIGYNYLANEIKIAEIEKGYSIYLPKLYTDYTNNDLEHYKKLADLQS
jgi:hypothetical protein